MSLYRIIWQSAHFGDSMVEANSEVEAIQKANAGQDTDFDEDFGSSDEWVVIGAEEVKE